MPIYTFRCHCGYAFDDLYPIATRPDTVECPMCHDRAKRVISISTVDTESECPAWIRSITDVVDRNDGKAHREFCDNPTRATYRRFMQETGLRHVEPGEQLRRETVDQGRIRRDMLESHRKRNTIVIG